MRVADKTISDYADYLAGDHCPVLVGGQAVNLWSEYVSKVDPVAALELQPFEPFVSKDCDVVGDRQVLQSLGARTHLKVVQYPFGQPSCCIGFLYQADDETKEPIIEVLYSVHGLGPQDLANSMELIADGRWKFRTLNPLQLLKAKLANAADLNQEKRQDVRHVRMLVPCVRFYIMELHKEAVAKNPNPHKNLKTHLTKCHALLQTRQAKKVSAQHQIDLHKCFPLEVLLNSPLSSVQNFYNHQLARP